MIASSALECIRSVKASLQLFERLGFTVHPVKSVLTPSRSITYLGFILNSVDLTITLTDEKKVKIQSFASQLLKEGVCCVRTLAKFIGQAVASFHGVMYRPLWCRALETDKMQGLRQGNGDYDSPVLLLEEAKIELQWWKDNILFN